MLMSPHCAIEVGAFGTAQETNTGWSVQFQTAIAATGWTWFFGFYQRLKSKPQSTQGPSDLKARASGPFTSLRTISQCVETQGRGFEHNHNDCAPHHPLRFTRAR
jgi:hypothetical protein